jgi:hypothetical protein
VEGAEPLQPDADEAIAIAVFNALKNGQGGIDWAGLPMVLEWFGVADVAGLLQRLLLIKSYRKPAERGEAAA